MFQIPKPEIFEKGKEKPCIKVFLRSGAGGGSLYSPVLFY